jgi:hypothetical protein
MYEPKRWPLLPRPAFYARLLRHLLVALGFVAGSLLLGIWGYRHFEHLSYLDALLNASMLLGGMGPVAELHTTGGKLFASFYALFSGICFLVIAGVLFAPVIHRFLHQFHLELAEREGQRPAPGDHSQARRPVPGPGRDDE